MNKFKVSIEKDKDGSYIAYNTNSDAYTLIGRGNTVKEAKADFTNSMKGVAEMENEMQGKCSDYLINEPDYKFDLSSLFEYYSILNVNAFARFLGINDTLMRQYKKGNTYISENQLHKIEDGIHRLGAEFSKLKLV